MIRDALSILRFEAAKRIDVVEDVIHDYAKLFLPYIRDQLSLPLAITMSCIVHMDAWASPDIRSITIFVFWFWAIFWARNV